jgi:transcription initiation factor IIF auxiliary subunit
MKNSKAFIIGQSSASSNSKKDYYDWQIWIKDGDMSISEVEKVEYLLHPTFPNRLRTTTDQASKFMVKSSGWGEFMIKVMVYTKNGQSYSFSHWLTLGNNYNNLKGTSADSRKTKKVFLSFSDADARMAKDLENRLSEMGIEVNSTSGIKPGSKMGDFIRDAISSSDAVIAIKPQYEDQWLNLQMDIANKASVKIIAVENTKRDLFSKIDSKFSKMDGSLGKEDIKSITDSLNEP